MSMSFVSAFLCTFGALLTLNVISISVNWNQQAERWKQKQFTQLQYGQAQTLESGGEHSIEFPSPFSASFQSPPLVIWTLVQHCLLLWSLQLLIRSARINHAIVINKITIIGHGIRALLRLRAARTAMRKLRQEEKLSQSLCNHYIITWKSNTTPNLLFGIDNYYYLTFLSLKELLTLSTTCSTCYHITTQQSNNYVWKLHSTAIIERIHSLYQRCYPTLPLPSPPSHIATLHGKTGYLSTYLWSYHIYHEHLSHSESIYTYEDAIDTMKLKKILYISFLTLYTFISIDVHCYFSPSWSQCANTLLDSLSITFNVPHELIVQFVIFVLLCFFCLDRVNGYNLFLLHLVALVVLNPFLSSTYHYTSYYFANDSDLKYDDTMVRGFLTLALFRLSRIFFWIATLNIASAGMKNILLTLEQQLPRYTETWLRRCIGIEEIETPCFPVRRGTNYHGSVSNWIPSLDERVLLARTSALSHLMYFIPFFGIEVIYRWCGIRTFFIAQFWPLLTTIPAVIALCIHTSTMYIAIAHVVYRLLQCGIQIWGQNFSLKLLTPKATRTRKQVIFDMGTILLTINVCFPTFFTLMQQFEIWNWGYLALKTVWFAIYCI